MINLQEEVKLFCASSKFQSISTGLGKIIEGQKINKEEKEIFEEVGNLFGQIDLDSKYYMKEHPELCVIATELRPEFYKTLLNLKIPFNQNFSERIYNTLKSYGKNMQLKREELNQMYKLFETMSTNIITKLQYAYGLSGQI
ncbi:MAG: hypothetical protein KJ949_02700 [Nanoarchaeota archaeon]|nr:hypothetical protein [Nanoarchaeota archaeon]